MPTPMCVWCNTYGKMHDDDMRDALGLERDDVTTPGDVMKGILNKTTFERSRRYWTSLMTPQEHASYEDECERLPQVVHAHLGTGSAFVRNCAAVDMDKLQSKFATMSHIGAIHGLTTVYVGAVRVLREVSDR